LILTYFVQSKSKKSGSAGDASGGFHATVTPAKPFNPVKDSEVIRKAVGKSSWN
jgi:hypothetical protein